MGTIAKIHRPLLLPKMAHLLPVLKTLGVRRLVVEPDASQSPVTLESWLKQLPSFVSLSRSPYLPTKTLRIDLCPSEKKIFSSFSEAKRRAVRRAIKYQVTVKESQNIATLIAVKNRSAGFFGFITTTGIKELWETFAPEHAAILLAYTENQTKPVGGVLLLFWDQIAYYWIAGATPKGKKRFAPTLLMFEAMKLAKTHGAKTFDMVGVWDERIPKENTSWKGFTKFKEGFGGKTLYYPLVTQKTRS